MAKKAASSEAPQLNKSQIIKAILDSGIEKPSLVVEQAKNQYGQEIGLPLVNTVKSGWKKAKGGTVGNGRAKKITRKLTAKSAVAKGGSTVEGGKVTGLTAIEAAIELTEKFGADKAREIIKVLWHEVGNA